MASAWVVALGGLTCSWADSAGNVTTYKVDLVRHAARDAEIGKIVGLMGSKACCVEVGGKAGQRGVAIDHEGARGVAERVTNAVSYVETKGAVVPVGSVEISRLAKLVGDVECRAMTKEVVGRARASTTHTWVKEVARPA